jgi:hypothetical protein
MKKTNAAVEREVVTLIALNERYADISLKTGVAIPTIKKIKKRNLDVIEQLKRRAIETQAEQVSSIIAKTNATIQDQLIKSERDQQELDHIESLYFAGEISRIEYLTRKRTLKPLTINQLIAIMRAAQRQVLIEQKV